MKGSIHSDQVCPVCGSRFRSSDGKRGLFCPDYPKIKPTRFEVRYGPRIHRRFTDYEAALQFLTGLRFQEGSGRFDIRDYQVRGKPLSFKKLAAEWLAIKAGQIKRSSLSSFQRGFERAIDAWGNANIKSIGYAQLEDFFNDYPGSPKTRLNLLVAFKAFWRWTEDRYDVPPLRKWPHLGAVEMAFRDTVDIPTQEAIINDMKEHEPFRVWLCIKWLANYIAIRPGEMRGLTEGQVDRQRGIIIVPHPKEKKPKIIPLIQEDIEIVRGLPLAFSPDMPFFRHEKSIKGGTRAGDQLGHNSIYRAWKRACDRLGVRGVSLYPGTKHSTAMGYRAIYTPEQIRAMTLHSTSAAFNRYFQTGGEDLRNLLEGRKTLADAKAPGNKLVTKNGGIGEGQVFNFSKK